MDTARTPLETASFSFLKLLTRGGTSVWLSEYMKRMIKLSLILTPLFLLGAICVKSGIADIKNSNTSINSNLSITDTTDWQTYTNVDHGFSFKYPGNWVYTNPISDDAQGLGYINPPSYTDSQHLLTMSLDDATYQFFLDREPTEWHVTKRSAININGVMGTHEVGEAPYEMSGEDYTYNSYFFPFDDSKTMTFFLADNDPGHIRIVEEILSSLTW